MSCFNRGRSLVVVDFSTELEFLGHLVIPWEFDSLPIAGVDDDLLELLPPRRGSKFHLHHDDVLWVDRYVAERDRPYGLSADWAITPPAPC